MDFQPRKMTIGDRIRFTFEVTAPVGMDISPLAGATVFGEWEVLESRPAAPRDAGGGMLERTYEYTLTTWAAGKSEFPGLALSYTTTGRKSGVYRTPPAAITVDSVLAGEKNPQEMRPPKGLIGYRSIWPWVWGALAVAAAFAAAWWWRRRRIRAALAAGLLPGVPLRPAEDVAREALDELAVSGLAESGEVKLFYIRLSDIIRRYVEGKFGIPALDRTTAELLPEIRRDPRLGRLAPEIRNFFEDCDLAKFAKYVPSPDDIMGDLAHARKVVDETAPKPIPHPVASMGAIRQARGAADDTGRREEE